jgi:hypothetical protein
VGVDAVVFELTPGARDAGSRSEYHAEADIKPTIVGFGIKSKR